MQPILPSQPSHFFLHPAAVTFAFNALGDPDNVGISVYSNAQVLLFVRDIDGLDQLPDNNYRSWVLSAYPTHFTDADGCARYCHIAFSRTTNQATLVFPDTRLDLLGRAITDDGQSFLAADGTPIATVPEDSSEAFAPNPDYYFAFIGKITASGPAASKQPRQWANIAAYPITGTLDTDYYYEYEQKGDLDKMFRYSSQYGNDGAILQLLPITVSRIWKLLIGTAEKAITDLFRLSDRSAEDIPATVPEGSPEATPTITAPLDEVIPTEAHLRDYTDQNFLSKKKGGVVAADVTFTHDVAVHGDSTVGGDQEISGDLTTHGNAAFGSNVGSETFAPDLLGTGWRIDKLGNAQMDSLVLRKFLEVPELRYNRVNVHVGVDWQTTGAGIIESVDTERQIITLKLEDGEFGAVQKGHMCMGIWHNLTDNDDENYDGRDGNFRFKGFKTVYFRIEEFVDEDGNTLSDDDEATCNKKYFRYSLREDWEQNHPCAAMSFAAYAHATNKDYQWCIYSTTEYLIILSGMVSWTYDTSNIVYIQGLLDGFTINGRDGKIISLEGIGIAVGKIYRWGTEIFIDREAQLLNQQLYYCRSAKTSDAFLAELSKASWTTTPQSPTNAEPYVYGYWLKTYTENGSDFTVPASGRPSASDVFVVSSIGLTGESAVGLTLDRSVIVVNAERSEWDDDDEEAQPELSGVQTATVTATMTYGTMRDDISEVKVGKVDGVTTNVRVSANTATIHITIGDGFDAAHESQLRVTFHSAHTDRDGITAIIVLHPAIDGEDGQEGEAGEGVSRVVEEYLATATEDERPTSDTVGVATSSQAGFSAEKCVLWNRTTTYNTSNLILARTPWEVISRWGEDGMDGLTISVDGSEVIYKTNDNSIEGITAKVNISVSRGDKQLEYANGNPTDDSFTCSTLNNNNGNIDGKVYWSFSVDETATIFTYTLYRMSQFEGVLDIPFTILVGQQEYHRTIHVRCVSEPTVYEIEPSLPNFIFNDTGRVTEQIDFNFYRTVGANPREACNCTYNITTKDISGAVTEMVKDGHGTSGSISGFPSTTRYITCEMLVNDNVVKRITLTGINEGQMGPQGPAGLNGCIINPRGEWQENVEYVNLSNATDNRYIDVVQMRLDDHTIGQFQRTTYNYPKVDNVLIYVAPNDRRHFLLLDAATDEYAIYEGAPTDPDVYSCTRWWRQSDTNAKFIAADLVMATNGYIRFLSGQSAYCLDENGIPVVGMQGAQMVDGAAAPQIFAGAKNGKALDAPFRVYGNGDVVAESFATGVTGPRMRVEDGMFAVYGNGALPNIKFGVDEDGTAVLQFLDDNGVVRYDLGSKHGLRAIAEITYPSRFDAFHFYAYVGEKTSEKIVSYMGNPTTLIFYRFVAGRVLNEISSPDAARYDWMYFENQKIVSFPSDPYNNYPDIYHNPMVNAIVDLGDINAVQCSIIKNNFNRSYGDLVRLEDLDKIYPCPQSIWSGQNPEDMKLAENKTVHFRSIGEIKDGVLSSRTVIFVS